MVGNQSAHFHREHSVSLGLDKGEVGKLDSVVVLSLEEVVDGNLLSVCRIGFPQRERDHLWNSTVAAIFRIEHKSLDCVLLLAIGCVDKLVKLRLNGDSAALTVLSVAMLGDELKLAQLAKFLEVL